MTHILMTRFAIALGRRVPSAAWLTRRFELFERYCLPSVLGQTFQEFEWRIFVHPAIDTATVERLMAYDRRILVRTEPVRPIVLSGTGRVVTTRLDSDDALAVDTLARIQAVAEGHRGGRPLLINCPTGWHLDHESQRAYLGRGGAFKALVERLQATGVFVDNCDRIGRRFPTHTLSGPAWLRVVHGGNLTNRFDARRASVPVSAVPAAAFPWLGAACA